MNIKKILTGTVLAAGMTAASAGAAGASHGHFIVIEDRDGQTTCRYIADGQTSKDAGDPGGHKFHDNVHTGQPGNDERGTDFDKSVNETARCTTVE